jgi:hypothetical protein
MKLKRLKFQTALSNKVGFLSALGVVMEVYSVLGRHPCFMVTSTAAERNFGQ